MNDVQVSKMLAYYLRHKPEELGLTLETGGWVKVAELIEALKKRRGVVLTMEQLDRIVENDDKQRYAYHASMQKIRANQGHSTEVDLQLEERKPPDVLYHGTAYHSWYRDGLKKMSRHHVHLSLDSETAMKVGQRHAHGLLIGKAIVLIIDAAAMYNEGHKFYVSTNGVWLTDHVPAKYIKRVP